MGCLKLTYYEPKEAPEVIANFFGNALEKNAPERFFRLNAYTYGFNGQLRDDQISGSGNSYDFGARMYNPRIGKFFSTDPREKDFPYWSPYLFAANNPIRFIDVNGEGPGDLFKTTDAAAIDFGKTYNPKSIKKNKEYGSVIIKVVKDDQVYYTYVKATKGKARSVDIKLRGETDFEASIHTHAAYTSDLVYPNTGEKLEDYNEEFSPGDKINIGIEEKVGYVVTPGGSVKKHTPAIVDGERLPDVPVTGETEVIDTENVPSDSNSPSRVNNIDIKPKKNKEGG